MQIKQIFVNLVARDLEKSKAFWIALGFTFNPQFSNADAASLVLGENLFAMLIVPKFFKTFTPKEIADTSQVTEAINAISVDTRAQVDELVDMALTNGATTTRPADDYGWMYSRSFGDLDGHLWEVLAIDISKAPPTPGN